MLKKRTESKKKKSSVNNSKNHKPLFANQTDKILFKLSSGFVSVKPSTLYGSSTQMVKTPKSSTPTATPSSKLRKQNK